MNVRVYTLSAIAVTASAVAGLWFGALVAHGQPDSVEAVRSSGPGTLAVTSATSAPPF